MYSKDGKTNIRNCEFHCFGIGFSSIVSGLLAGIIETLMTHPLDVIKTRMQNQTTTSSTYKMSPNYYGNMFECMIKMSRNEGFRSFYKGVTAELIADPLKRAMRLSLFEQINIYLFQKRGDDSFRMWVLAGVFTGVSEALIMTPFEHIKVQMQTNVLKNPPKIFSVIKVVISTNGFGITGLYRGFDSTLFCKTLFSGTFFGTYHFLKDKLPVIENAQNESIAYFFCGLTSAMIAAFINTPFDVAKTRVQSVTNNKYNYVFCIPTMRHIYRVDGISGLYQGLLPRLLLAGLENGIVMVVYEFVLDIFKRCKL